METSTTTSVVFFPQEIIENILSRLPLKSLKLFRQVSKTWDSLITNPCFFKSYIFRGVENRKILLFLSNKFNLPPDTSRFPLQTQAQKLSDLNAIHRTIIWNSCDGLFCMSNKDDVVLWNPSTKHYKALPDPIRCESSEIYIWTICVYGIGYNPFYRDYEVIRVHAYPLFSDLDGKRYVVQIYSLRSNSWRRIEDTQYSLFDHRQHGEYVDGKLNWLATELSQQRTCIVAYDFGQAKFREVPSPIHKFTGCVTATCINSLDGKLFLSNFCLGDVEGWVMMDYGLSESWTCIFRLDLKYSHPIHFKPLFTTKEGAIVMHFVNTVVLYDPKDSEVINFVKVLELKDKKCYLQPRMYTQCLVSLDQGSKKIDWIHL